MKTGSLVRLLACEALLTMGVTLASAQMRANIPFDLMAAGPNLVAGEYTLETTGDSDQLLQMCNLQQHRCVFMIASQVASKAKNDPGKLVRSQLIMKVKQQPKLVGWSLTISHSNK